MVQCARQHIEGESHASINDYRADGAVRDHGRHSKLEGAMLTALVLICSIAVTPDLRDCDPINARVVMRTPEAYTNPVTCAMHGQAYLAETAIGRALAKDDRVKIVCMRLDEVDEAIAGLPEK
jgi:hypothetical protein